MLTVNEIFHSIQGESTRAGNRCVFVGSPPAIFAAPGATRRTPFTKAGKCRWTTCSRLSRVTDARRGDHRRGAAAAGGVYELMDRLLAVGHTVMLETGGHRPIDRVPAQVVKIVDVKCPGSGEAEKNEWGNLDCLAPHDEVKFVVVDRADYEFARDVVVRLQLASRAAAILFRPCTARWIRRRCPNG